MGKAKFRASLTGKKKASGSTVNFDAEFIGMNKTFASGGNTKDLNNAALAAVKSQNPGIVSNSPHGEVTGLKVLGYSKIANLEGSSDDKNSNHNDSTPTIFKKPYWAIPLRLVWNIIKGLFKIVFSANPFK